LSYFLKKKPFTNCEGLISLLICFLFKKHSIILHMFFLHTAAHTYHVHCYGK